MSSNHEPANKSDKDTRKLQRDKNGNKDPTATSVDEDVTTKEEETEYYEEGNGGATD